MDSRFSRRTLISRALLAGASVPAIGSLLTACGGGSAATTPASAAVATQAPAAPAPAAGSSPVASPAAASSGAQARQGGALVVGEDNQLQPFSYNTAWVNEAQWDIYEHLLAIDPSNQLVPYLAASFEVAPDGLTVTYHIKSGKTFHNGDPLDATVLKALFDRWTAPKSDYGETYFQAVTKIEAPDAQTLVFTLKAPDAEAYLGTAYLYSPIVDPTAVASAGQDYGKTVVVGSGPFKFDKWEGDSVSVVRNPDYSNPPAFMANKGPAYLDRITYTFIPDLSTRTLNLESGTFDIVRSPAPQDVAQLEKNPDVTVIKEPAISILYMGFNFKKQALLGDKRVREAIFRAVDRQPIIDRVLFGQANPAYSPVVSFDAGYWKGSETLYPYDLAAAKTLLDDAGWQQSGAVRTKGGQPLALNLIVVGNSEQTTVAQVIQEQLGQIGVKINIEVLDKGTDQQRQLAGDYDLNFFQYLYDTSIDVLKILYSSTTLPPNGANWAFYTNPQLDAQFAKYRTSTNPNDRIQAVIEVQKILLGDVVQVPLYNPLMIWGVRKWVQGFKPYPYWTYPLMNDTWVTAQSPRAKSS